MRRLTYGQIKETIARVVGQCSTSSDVLAYTNEAQEMLLNRSTDPVGSWMRYQVCTGTEDCLVWPRQIRTIKAFWVCNTPGRFVSEWYEAVGFWEGGRGQRDSDSYSGNLLIDRGTACSFDNVIATTAEPRKIQVVAADSSDNGKKITLRYIDSNGNRKYTSIDGVVQEGEELILSTSGTLTSSNVATNGLYHVVKATTNYPVRLYSYDVNSATQSSLLAVYEPSETVPIYRRTFLPGLTDMAACPGAESVDCTANKSVTVLARLQHVPVVVDNDPLVIGNVAALKNQVQAIIMRERHEYQAARELEDVAARELDGEIASYLGDGLLITTRHADVETYGAGGVLNYV